MVCLFSNIANFRNLATYVDYPANKLSTEYVNTISEYHQCFYALLKLIDHHTQTVFFL